MVGEVVNGRRVLSEQPRTDSGARVVRVICQTCGRVSDITQQSARASGCGECRTVDRSPENYEEPRQRLLAEAGDRCPEIWRDDDVPIEILREAVGGLVALLGPLDMAEVGALLGLSRQRVCQIEQAALVHARRRMGPSLREELRDALREDAKSWRNAS